MNKQIERIYIGLPPNLKDKILWVKREFRTNPLSHLPGGTDIVIVYHNGEVLGYDWIKNPIEYINNLDLIKECYSANNIKTSTGDNKLNIVFNFNLFKSEVSGIYVRKYKTENYKTTEFEKVWDFQLNDETPVIVIENYLNKSVKH